MRRLAQLFFARHHPAQDLVEFGIMLPVLVLIIVGIVDFAQVFNGWLVVTSAAREGARYGAVGHSAGEITSFLSPQLVGLPGAVVNVTGAGGQAGTNVTVNVTASVPLVMSIPGLAGPITVGSQTTMRIEGPLIP